MFCVPAAQKGIHVLHVHPGVGEGLKNPVQSPGHVRNGDAQHRGHAVHKARVFQDGSGLVDVVHNHPGDPEIAGLSQRKGPHVDVILSQHPGHGVERTGFVLQKYRNLFDAHRSFLLKSSAGQ